MDRDERSVTLLPSKSAGPAFVFYPKLFLRRLMSREDGMWITKNLDEQALVLAI
jgi:hypothetical protein